MSRKSLWKTFQITDMDDVGRLQSAWASSKQAFGPNRVFDVSRASGDIETNLTEADLRSLFRHSWVKFPKDYVTDTMTLEERVKEWEKDEDYQHVAHR